MALVTLTIPYAQGPGVGQGYYSATVPPGATGIVQVFSTAGAVTLVLQRYGEAPLSIPIPAGTSYGVSVGNLATIGILAGADLATGTIYFYTTE